MNDWAIGYKSDLVLQDMKMKLTRLKPLNQGNIKHNSHLSYKNWLCLSHFSGKQAPNFWKKDSKLWSWLLLSFKISFSTKTRTRGKYPNRAFSFEHCTFRSLKELLQLTSSQYCKEDTQEKKKATVGLIILSHITHYVIFILFVPLSDHKVVLNQVVWAVLEGKEKNSSQQLIWIYNQLFAKHWFVFWKVELTDVFFHYFWHSSIMSFLIPFLQKLNNPFEVTAW